MAKTIAKCFGFDSTRMKEAHRLGSKEAHAEAATWRTFARAYVSADGHGSVVVERDGKELHRFEFGPEA